MAIPKFLEDLAIISKLGDNPGSDNGLTTSAFRAKFDEAALKIQAYLNNVIVPAISATASPENGLKMKANLDMNGYKLLNIGTPTNAQHAATKGYVDSKTQPISIKLAASAWSNNCQTVTASGVTTNNDIDISPSAESHTAYCEAGVFCSAQGNGSLTFVCADTPTADLTVNVRVWN